MNRPSRIAKRLLLPALLAATLVVVQVVLAAPPTASFLVSGPPGNECGVYTFSSTANDPDGDIASTDWSLGGAAATGPTVQATFGSPGAREITMSVTDGSLGDGDGGPETVPATPQTVNVVNGGPPNAAVSATPTTAQLNQLITFNATPGSSDQGSGSIVKYEWDKDGNGSYEADTGAIPSTTASFATDGPHTVGLQVTDNCNAKDTASVNVFVNNAAPTASFTVTPNPAPTGSTITFNAAASSDTGGSIVKYEWDFDNDDVFELDTGAVATTTKDNLPSGFYAVQLRVTDNDGATGTTLRTFRVNAKPTPSFVATPNPALVGEAVNFSAATSSDPDGTIASYQWDLDGNGSLEATGVTPPARSYNAPGTVKVTLRVTDNNGDFAELTRDVTVQTTRPNAALTFSPQDPLPGQPVTLASTSTPSTSPGAPALESTQWDLDYSPTADFTIDAAGGSIVTSFATPGPHTVAVKVTETGGGFAIKEATIFVNAPPQASFTVAPAKAVEGREVTFASTSGDPDGPLVKQEWDLDNNGSYERAGGVVSTTKLKKGTRTVRLRVTDSKGATAVSTQALKVTAKPLKPPLDISSSVRYHAKKWGIVLKTFTVSVQSRTKVAVSCKGRGCPRGTFRKSSKSKRALLRFSKLKGNLRAGAKISIIFARPGHMTGWDTITVRGGVRRTVLREACKPSGARKPKRCPGA